MGFVGIIVESKCKSLISILRLTYRGKKNQQMPHKQRFEPLDIKCKTRWQICHKILPVWPHSSAGFYWDVSAHAVCLHTPVLQKQTFSCRLSSGLSLISKSSASQWTTPSCFAPRPWHIWPQLLLSLPLPKELVLPLGRPLSLSTNPSGSLIYPFLCLFQNGLIRFAVKNQKW